MLQAIDNPRLADEFRSTLKAFYVQTERHTSHGRVDVLMQTANFVYFIELKLDGTSDDALRQVEEKQYAAPFAMDSRQIVRIGANFVGELRQMKDWKIV